MTGRRRVVIAAQVAAFATVAWFVWATLGRQWEQVRAEATRIDPKWGAIAISCLVVLVTYALLIQTWRMVLGGWGQRIGYWDAAQIWTISNLGRYVPGKVWQLAAMAKMASAEGVSGATAAGSALIVTLINLVAGFVVAGVTGARLLKDAVADELGVAAALMAVVVLLGAAIVLAPGVFPRVVSRAAKLVGRSVSLPTLTARVVWLTALASTAAWVLYGLAFRTFGRGVLGTATGATSLYIAVFTVSYLLGFIALFAPGGLGVRETVMGVALHKAGFDLGSTAVLVVTSRLWLTVLEILPAALFWAYRAVRRKP